MSVRKIFCLGFQKTGTTTLKKATDILGYSSCPYRERMTGWISVLEGNFEAILTDIIDRYDVFQDNPFYWPHLIPGGQPAHEWIYDRYPDSYFILTVRRDTATWKESFASHMGKTQGEIHMQKHAFIYGHDTFMSGDYDGCARVYEQQNQAVRDFFSTRCPEHFAEFCWETGDAWPQLCGFLGKDIPDVEFPRANKTAKLKTRDRFKRWAKQLLR
ncbi:MAG: sulfotransferase family protein [Cyanobacteria bacterium J06639_1]